MIATRIALLALLVAPALAYPQFWATEYAPNCLAVPTKGAHCHKSPVSDPSVAVAVMDGGKAVKTACAGKAYTVTAVFPQARLAYLTFGSGATVTAKTAYNKRCPNSMTFTGTPGKAISVSVAAPRTPGTWQMSLVSATGGCSPFYITIAAVPVAKC